MMHTLKSLVNRTVSGVILCWLILAACAPTPTPEPTPSPTPTQALTPIDNENVQALNEAHAALDGFEFGLAPLLLLDETRLVIESGPDGDIARLAYPRQPADPLAWPSMDSFVLSYAIRGLMLDSPQVRRIALGKFEIAATVDDPEDRISHYAVWIRFTDRSEAVVDFSPLATNFAARHAASEFITQADEIDGQFTDWRDGVPLNILQPMKVVEQNGAVYYLIARTLVFPDHYEFSLRAHLTQTATPIRPLQLTRGAMVKIDVKRTDFEAVRKLMLDAGPTIFNQQPGLLSRAGDSNPALVGILDDNVHLLWHMVTKLEQLPSARAAATPRSTATPTAIPTPTPTPTPTATPTKPNLPLGTS